MTTDIVIPLGQGSKWNNNELLYCLRSIGKHGLNVGRIFIVGDFPAFLNYDAIHIEQPFVSGNPARNIALNLLEAVRDERLSETFAYFNDDYILTKQVDISNLPTYYKEDLERTYKQNVTEYKRHVKVTLDSLKANGLPTLNYDTHYPCLFDKQKLRELIEGTNFNMAFGHILKSLYFNIYSTYAAQKTDCKQYQIKPLSAWVELANNTEIISICDTCINNDFKKFLSETFPEKSKWER